MGHIEIKPELVPDHGWAGEFAELIALVNAHPYGSIIVFLGIIIILVFMPGGVGPAWVKYRGAKRRLEQRQTADVEHTVEILSKRAQRRLRGRQKGKRR